MQKHYTSNKLCIYGSFKRVLQKSNYHKEHLSLILVWQQEESENGGVGDLVVKRLTVKVKESWVDTDVVSKGKKKIRKLRYSAKRTNQNTLTRDYELNGYFSLDLCYDNDENLGLFLDLPSSGSETLQLFEDTHSISSGLDDISLRQHILSKGLWGIQHFHSQYMEKREKVGNGGRKYLLTSTGSCLSSVWLGGT